MGFVNEVRARPPATRQGTFQPHVLRPVPFSRRNICSLQYLIPEACGRALGWPLAPVRSGGLLSGRKNDRRPQGTRTWPLRRAVDGAARALAASGTGSLVPAPAARLPRPRRTGRRTQASWRPDISAGLEAVSRRFLGTVLLRVLGRGWREGQAPRVQSTRPGSATTPCTHSAPAAPWASGQTLRAQDPRGGPVTMPTMWQVRRHR